MKRVDLGGKGQALDGDSTTTGATCIASGRLYQSDSRYVLRKGDWTTECPACGQPGTIDEGVPWFTSEGRQVAMDGARVACACPSGSNRVIAPLTQTYASTPTGSHDRTSKSLGQEPGFYIVPKCMTYQEILLELGAPQASLPDSILKRLNPTFEQGFKAGEIFLINDGPSRPTCTPEELQGMSAAKQAREALASLAPDEAEFMVKHHAEIAGLLSDISLSVGVSQAMMTRSLDELTSILREIETLHQEQFAKHGHLHSTEFFEQRMRLLKQLNTNLKATFLNKRLDLGSYERLRRDLGISSKSLVHHWSKAGAPGQIPGYSTHLRKIAAISKYLDAGGHIGIGIGGVGAVLNVHEVCRQGATSACQKIKVTEAGNFSAGLAGGWAGGKAGGKLAMKACLGRGSGISKLVCGIAVTGAGAFVGSTQGMKHGEELGEIIFEALNDD